jgi:hypothetical protein
MPDEHHHGERQRAWRAISGLLLALAALAFGAMGACGVVNSVSSITHDLSTHDSGVASIGLLIGVPAAIVGLGGAYFSLRALLRRFRRLP